MQSTYEQVKEGYHVFKNEMKTLMMSSISKEGIPHISYAPFVEYEGQFYIYVSKTAEHFENLIEERPIEVMLIKDEVESNNLYARQRLRYLTTPRIVDEESFEEVFTLFASNHSKPLIDLLRKLDFSLFQLRLEGGRYVVGFGQAYDIDCKTDELFQVVIEKGMKK